MVNNYQPGIFIVVEAADNAPLFWHSTNLDNYLQDCLGLQTIKMNPFQGNNKITPQTIQSMGETAHVFMKEGAIVIAERYTLSAIVQEVMNGKSLNTVIEEYKDSTVPDLTFYLNLSTSPYQDENHSNYNLLVNNDSPCICKEKIGKLYEELIHLPCTGREVSKFSKVDKNFVTAALPGTVFNYLKKTRNLRTELSAARQ